MRSWLNNKTFVTVFTLASVGVLGFFDYITGIDLNFFVFYFIPVIIAAWKINRSWAIAVSVLSAMVWGSVDFLSGHIYSSSVYYFWNAGIRLFSFILLAVFVDLIRVLLRKQQELNAELSKTLSDVKQLKGFLPICASCKKIRNDKGYWEQIEKYISSRSEAEFTHGICPECIERLYGADKIAARSSKIE